MGGRPAARPTRTACWAPKRPFRAIFKMMIYVFPKLLTYTHYAVALVGAGNTHYQTVI